MTKAIILPSGKAETFRPLTYQLPVGMLPLVNKPLIEHQVELLVRNGITGIWLSSNHMGNKVEEYFGTGKQWGATISHHYEKPPFGSVPALKHIRESVEGATLVILESDVVADLDLNAVLESHRQNRADATFACPITTSPSFGLSVALDGSGRIRSVRANSTPAAARHLADGGICIIEPEVLELLPDAPGYSILQTCWLATQKVRLNMYGYQTDKPLTRLTNWKTYYKAQSDILEGRFPGILVPGMEVQKGVWVGRNVTTAGDVWFDGPVVIGDHCTIGKKVRLGSGTVIGHNVRIDSGASIERSVVLPRTYVGKGTVVSDSIIMGNLLIDIQRNSCTSMSDTMTLAEITGKHIGFRAYQILNRVLAVLVGFALLPVFLLIVPGLVLTGNGPAFSRTRRIGVDLRSLALGTLKLRVFELVYLGGFDRQGHPGYGADDPPTRLPRFLARLGNIFNIIRGDIMFVGNRPMDPEYAFSITEEWQRTRFKCQAGLISIIDTISEEVGDDERSVTEGYYAVSRNPGMDAVVVVKAGRKLFHSVLRRMTTRRTTPTIVSHSA